MSFRITDTSSSSNLVSRINSQRARVDLYQEQISSGKRINRPSDDPAGTALVVNIRVLQDEVKSFQRVSATTNQKLVAADDALNGYEKILDRMRALTTQGLSDSTSQATRNSIANEFDSLRAQILSSANRQNTGEYIFGGTRQNAPPFDVTTGVPAGTPATPQYTQIEPGGTPLASGVVAEGVFSDAVSNIFADITAASAALRGTGNPVADKATLTSFSMRLGTYSTLSGAARTLIGTNMRSTETATDNLSATFLALEERAASVEDVDFAQAAIGLSSAQRSLDATLQVASQARRSLFDYLG